MEASQAGTPHRAEKQDLGCGPCLWTHRPDGASPDERTGGDVLPLCDPPPQHPISAGLVLDLVRQMTALLQFDPAGGRMQLLLPGRSFQQAD